MDPRIARCTVRLVVDPPALLLLDRKPDVLEPSQVIGDLRLSKVEFGDDLRDVLPTREDRAEHAESRGIPEFVKNVLRCHHGIPRM